MDQEIEYMWFIGGGVLAAMVLGLIIWPTFRKKFVLQPQSAAFVLIDGPIGPRYRRDLKKLKITIGRAADSDIQLKDESVELHHAEVHTWRSGNVYVIDRSISGIVFNGEKVNRSQQVNEGAQLRIGSVSMIFSGLSDEFASSKQDGRDNRKRSSLTLKSKFLIGMSFLVILLLMVKIAGVIDDFYTTLTPMASAQVETSDCDLCPLLISIPAGSFYRGSPNEEKGHLKTEEPMRKVTISNFYLSKNLITRKEWNACVSDGGCKVMIDVSTQREENLPVTMVSWYDATIYVEWLNKRSGLKTYRLPSEAEWEYAARAGTMSRFPSGEDESVLNDYVWYLQNSNSMESVGTKKPNGFGLYDMGGNVFQWTWDCWNPSYLGAPDDGKPMLKGNCDGERVIRGGAWNSAAKNVRPASRFHQTADHGFSHLGFRVVRSP